MSFLPSGESSLAADPWIERSNMDGLIIAAVAYGVLFTLCLQCVRLLLFKPSRGKVLWPLVACVGVMFTLATIGFAANAKFNEMTGIDDRDIPGGPNSFRTFYSLTGINMMRLASYIVLSWAADFRMIYRYAVIWNFNVWMLLFPGLMYMASISMSIALLVTMTRHGASIWTSRATRFALSYWSLSISLNIVITILIVTRLLRARNHLRAVLGKDHAQNYTSVIAMLVESAALFSIWGLVFIISYARDSPFQNIVFPSLGPVQAMAPVLITLRVAEGRAWSQETVTMTNVIFPDGTNSKITAQPAAPATLPLRDITLKSYRSDESVVGGDRLGVDWELSSTRSLYEQSKAL